MVKAVVDAVDIDLKTGTTLGYYTFGEDRPNILVLGAMNGRSATDIYASYLIMKHLEGLERIDGSVTFLPVASSTWCEGIAARLQGPRQRVSG